MKICVTQPFLPPLRSNIQRVYEKDENEMGLEEQIAEAIISAFDELGGDPQNAVSAARNHATIESWMQQETAMVALA